MKTLIIMGIVAVICYFAFKSLYKTMTGKKGCGCSGSKAKTCPGRGKCPK
ncbi:MAG: FeoB-associated Cys-rich membrane protein [Fusobacteriaceae bacterium]